MELRRLSIFIAFFVIFYVAQSSGKNAKVCCGGSCDCKFTDHRSINPVGVYEARHSIERRDADVNYDDILADEATDDEAQNDADGGNDQADEDVEVTVNTTIVTNPNVYSKSAGDTVRLECVVSPNDAVVVVQWTKNNSMYFVGTKKPYEIDLSSPYNKKRCTIAPNSTDLVITNIQPEDAGVYKCNILQKNIAAIEHTLNYVESPKIIRFTGSSNGQVVEGEDLVLTCEVKGSPPPQIVWSRDSDRGNKRLQEKDGEFSINSVSIKNVNKEHSGRYYCYAFNGFGDAQAVLMVNVMGKPRVNVHKYVINSAVNVEAVLECSVHDHLASHIRWYKDGVLIEDSSNRFTVSTNGQNSTLTVIPTADNDFGTFTCEAENDLGNHNKSIDLVQSPVVEELNVDGPKLIWTVHSHQPLQEMEIQIRDVNGENDWQMIDVPLPSQQNHKYEVIYNLLEKQVQPGKYEATVRVRNDKSWSTQMNTAFVDIEAQPQLIQHASVYRGAGNEAHYLRPATATVLSTTIMYLLVRML